MRFLGYIALVYVTWTLLGLVPFLRSSFISLWVAVILVSVGLSAWGRHALVWRRSKNERRALEAVETPNNRGKLGAMLLASGSAKSAIPLLEQAVEGEPETLEWSYRLGCANLERRRYADAKAALARVIETDAEYAYGAAQLRYVESLQQLGESDEALEALDVFDRNHGESPESAFRRGLANKDLGRKEEARQSFARVRALASSAARYQKGAATSWAFRSLFGGYL